MRHARLGVSFVGALLVVVLVVAAWYLLAEEPLEASERGPLLETYVFHELRA